MKKNISLAFLVLLNTTIHTTISKTSGDVLLHKVEESSKAKKWNLVSHMFSMVHSTDKTIEQEKTDVIRQQYLEFDVKKRKPIATIFGWVSLPLIEHTILTNPKKHNAIVSSLIRNPKLMKQLEQLLKNVRKSESSLLSFWEEEYDEENVSLNRLHVQKKQPPKVYKNYSPAWKCFYNTLRKSTPQWDEAAMGAVVQIATGVFVDASNDCPSRKKLHYLLNDLHTRINGIALIIHTVDAVSDSLKQHPELTALPHAQALKILKVSPTKKQPSSLPNLINLLRTTTFKSKPSFFSCKGRVRTASLLINDIKDELIPLLMALGELDAYLAYAKMYVDLQ